MNKNKKLERISEIIEREYDILSMESGDNLMSKYTVLDLIDEIRSVIND